MSVSHGDIVSRTNYCLSSWKINRPSRRKRGGIWKATNLSWNWKCHTTGLTMVDRRWFISRWISDEISEKWHFGWMWLSCEYQRGKSQRSLRCYHWWEKFTRGWGKSGHIVHVMNVMVFVSDSQNFSEKWQWSEMVRIGWLECRCVCIFWGFVDFWSFLLTSGHCMLLICWLDITHTPTFIGISVNSKTMCEAILQKIWHSWEESRV